MANSVDQLEFISLIMLFLMFSKCMFAFIMGYVRHNGKIFEMFKKEAKFYGFYKSADRFARRAIMAHILGLLFSSIGLIQVLPHV